MSYQSQMKNISEAGKKSYSGVILAIAGVLALVVGTAHAQGAELPVRINRSFFEKNVTANLRAATPQGGTAEVQSPVRWVQGAFLEPAPSEDNRNVLADFRDSTTCAELPDSDQIRLCFYTMGDVSNVGVNDREMWLAGAETLSGNADCPVHQGGQIATPKFQGDPAVKGASIYKMVSAQREQAGGYKIRFAQTESSCAPAEVEVRLAESS